MPRVASRLFPDVLQGGIGTGVVLSQSRVTFTGQRGIVVVAWHPLLSTTFTVARLAIGVEIVGNALLGLPIQGATTSALDTNGDEFSGWSFAVVQDPAEGSFLEIQTLLNASVVDIQALRSQLFVLSFAPEVGAGPTVAFS